MMIDYRSAIEVLDPINLLLSSRLQTHGEEQTLLSPTQEVGMTVLSIHKWKGKAGHQFVRYAGSMKSKETEKTNICHERSLQVSCCSHRLTTNRSHPNSYTVEVLVLSLHGSFVQTCLYAHS